MIRKKRTGKQGALWKYWLFTLLIGLAGWLGGGVGSYSALQAPPLAPPGWVFPVVWTVLYTLMAIAAWRILCADDVNSPGALRLYAFQLVINALWPVLFFRMEWRFFALLWILLLIALVILTLLRFYSIRPVAAWLLAPYLLWCLFAAYLNLGFYLLNAPR